MLEGGDGDGEGDEDVEGDEVQVQPPPPQPPIQPLPEALQKALGKDSAVCRKAAAAPWSAQVLKQGYGPDQPIFLTQARVIAPYTDFWVAYLGKRVRARGSGGGYATKGGAGHGQPLPGGPMTPLPERISWGSLGGLNPLADPPGGQVWHRPLPGVPTALGSPWMVPTLAAGQVGAVCTGVVCRAVPAHLHLRSRGPSHLRRAGDPGRGQPGAWLPSLGRHPWRPPPLTTPTLPIP